MYDLEVLLHETQRRMQSRLDSLGAAAASRALLPPSARALHVSSHKDQRKQQIQQQQPPQQQPADIEQVLAEQQLELQASSAGATSKVQRIVRCRVEKGGRGGDRVIAGLEPGAAYVLRIRAHNKLGFGPYSPWSSPVTPQHGVQVAAEGGRVALRWFAPLLHDRHTVAGYEVQLCKLRGPLTFQHVRAEERDLPPPDDPNEFFSLAPLALSCELSLAGLKAGARYKCRVRPLVKPRGAEGRGEFLDWEHALTSPPFAIPPGPPDAPHPLMPRLAPG
eukprot:gene44268-54136_t